MTTQAETLTEVIKSLADLIACKPDQVRVRLESRDPLTRYVKIECNSADVGRLVGTGGSRISAFSDIATMIARGAQWVVYMDRITRNNEPEATQSECASGESDAVYAAVARCCEAALGDKVLGYNLVLDTVPDRSVDGCDKAVLNVRVNGLTRASQYSRLSRDLTMLMVGARGRLGMVVSVNIKSDEQHMAAGSSSSDAAHRSSGTNAVSCPQQDERASGMVGGSRGAWRQGGVRVSRLGRPARQGGAGRKGRATA